MLLDGLAQGTGPLAVYDADVFQMCQISVVQIFIEGGEGLVYRFAQQIDLSTRLTLRTSINGCSKQPVQS